METENKLNKEIPDQNTENFDTESPVFEEKEAYEIALRCAHSEKILARRSAKIDVLNASIDSALSGTRTCLWVYSILALMPLGYIIYALISQTFGDTLWIDIMFIVCFVFATVMLIFYIFTFFSEKKEKKYVATMRQETDQLEADILKQINSNQLVKKIYTEYGKD